VAGRKSTEISGAWWSQGVWAVPVGSIPCAASHPGQVILVPLLQMAVRPGGGGASPEIPDCLFSFPVPFAQSPVPLFCC
jgi:hypothetical protein